MNSLTWKLFTAAATVAIAATTASAQHLTASVPFPFTVGVSSPQGAGDYKISNDGSEWYITSVETQHTVLAVSRAGAYSNATSRSQLVFHCRAKGCALYQVRAGSGGSGAIFAEPKRSKSDARELACVVLVPLNTSNSD